jgi:hypothetical protein
MELPWLLHHRANSWQNVSEEAFRSAYEKSTSFIEVVRHLDLPCTARRRDQVKQIAEYLNLDLTRFDGKRGTGGGCNWLGAQHHLRQKQARGKFGALRKSLLERGRPYKCELCDQLPVWNGRSLTLQLDHKNGNKYDDREENLRFLCPNCHSQTDTFAGRNRNRPMPP